MITRMKGAILRQRRQALGLTQQRLADRLDVSRNTIARWEREERAIPGFLDLALKTIEREKPTQATTTPESMTSARRAGKPKPKASTRSKNR